MPKRLESTPRLDGYRMPGEFEKHDKCWMIWPERTDNWRNGAKPAQKAFVDVAKAIIRFEPLTVLVSKGQFQNARDMLPEEVQVVEMANDDSWVRDCGPTFVVNEDGDVRGVDWEFNAWGGLVDGLYFPWDNDDQVARKVCELEQVDSYRTEGFVLEGGSIHVDGEGTCIVTEACLLSEGRNPHLSKEEIEQHLKDYLNVEKVIWLEEGIYLDETNEHVDNIIHYVGPAKLVLAWTDDVNDPQYSMSKKAFDLLSNETDAKGRKFEIHKLHIPSPPIVVTKEESEGVDSVEGTLPREEGDRQAASYANFLIVNGGIILPVFDREQDQMAIDVLKEAMPEHEIVTVPGREIVLGGGNVHCITQQQPAKTIKNILLINKEKEN